MLTETLDQDGLYHMQNAVVETVPFPNRLQLSENKSLYPSVSHT